MAYGYKIGALSYVGQAYVITKSDGTWTQAILGTGTASMQQFGGSVSVSADGMTAVVGAKGESGTYNNGGQAYVFTKAGGTWTQAILGTATAADQLYGTSVSVSADGTTAVVGAPSYTTDTVLDAGRASVLIYA